MQRRTPGTADRRASGIAAPQFAHRLRDLPCGRRLWARRMPSLTVASICSLTALSPVQPVAMSRTSKKEQSVAQVILVANGRFSSQTCLRYVDRAEHRAGGFDVQ